MIERIANHELVIERITPTSPTGDDLENMQRLYTYDAAEAYGRIIEDGLAKNALKKYFTDKAQSLPSTLSDSNQQFWTARQDGSVVGMAGYNCDRRLIHSVYVSGEARSRGIGAALMRAVIEDTKTANPDEARTLLVASANTRAVSFYEKLGFALTGNKKDWNIGGASISELEMAL